MRFKFYFWVVHLYLIYSVTCESVDSSSNDTSINRIDQNDQRKCPEKCVCVDLTGNGQSNHTYVDSNSFEVNCTDIHSDLENILSQVPTKTTHLYLYRNVFSTENRLRFRKLDKLKFLKLTLNSIQYIDEDAFLNISSLNTLKISYNKLIDNSILKPIISKLKKLKSLTLQNNQIKSLDKNALSENVNLESIEIKESSIELEHDAFNNLSILKSLTLSSIERLGTLPNLTNLSSLEHLTVDRCELRFIPSDLCDWLSNVKSLTFKSNRLSSLPYLNNCTELQLVDLSYNYITSLDCENCFPAQNKIIYLFLKNNLIRELEENNFKTFSSLQVLDLESNAIAQIHLKAFLNLTNLRDLNLGKNKFSSMPTDGLENIVELKTFGNINLKEFPAPIYFPRVQKLALSYAYHCCEFMRKENVIEKMNSFDNLMDEIEFTNKIYEKVTWLQNDHINKSVNHLDTLDSPILENTIIMNYHIDCIPKPSPFMPCEDLFDFWTLRCSVWLVFLLAVLGNATVIVVLLFGRTKLDVPRFLVANLAFADFLMGIYLCILAFVDSATLTMFRSFAVTWQNSATCSLAGFLAVFSTELSVFVLAIITLERNYAITNAMHLNKRLSLRKASIIMFFGYIFVAILALLPLIGISSYSKFAVCLPFEIEDKWSRIYVLSLVIFNGFACLILIGCYLRMYCAIRGSQVWLSHDSIILRRMSLLVFTDFLCWAPIALCTISSVFFGVNLINLSQAKIFTIFILPLNSCCNPFLYAIFTKQFKKDCITLCKKLEESRITRGIGCKHSSNFSNRHTPECTNSIEKHYSDCLYCRQQLPNQYCVSTGCKSVNKKSPFSHNQITKQFATLSKKEDDDVFHGSVDEESLLKQEMTSYFLKNNYNLILNRIDDDSRLVCKCGITTILPKSLLFFDNYQTTGDSTKVANRNESMALKEGIKETNEEEDVFEDEQAPRSLIRRMLNSFLRRENLFLVSKKERSTVDKNDVKCDCQLNGNEIKQDEINTDLFFKQHAERLHEQLIKSKQRLDSISSENWSSRSDSWKQQASQQLKMIEKYFHDKVRHPALTKYDFRKNSAGTTGSCTTSTFRISRSSVSSDNFKPLDHRLLSTIEDRKEDEEDLKKHLFENRCNEKLIKNRIDSDILNDLFKQFLCTDCKALYTRHTKDANKVTACKQELMKELRDLKECRDREPREMKGIREEVEDSRIDSKEKKCTDV